MIMKLLQEILTLILVPIMFLFEWLFGTASELESLLFAFEVFMNLLSESLNIVNYLCPISYIMPAINVWFTVWLGLRIYHLFMFVVKKVPMLNIND